MLHRNTNPRPGGRQGLVLAARLPMHLLLLPLETIVPAGVPSASDMI